MCKNLKENIDAMGAGGAVNCCMAAGGVSDKAVCIERCKKNHSAAHCQKYADDYADFCRGDKCEGGWGMPVPKPLPKVVKDKATAATATLY